jgi:adenylate cyclase
MCWKAACASLTTGGHLWSERYDRPLKDIFALQDEIVQKIVMTLKLQLTLWEQGVLVRKTTDNLEAYDTFLRGMEYTRRSTKESNAQARQMFQRATDLDPTYAEVHAWLGYSYWLEWYSQWSRDPQILEQAFASAQQALALEDSLPVAHSVLGLVYMWKKQHDQAIAEGERAVVLAPNNADSSVWLARILVYVGRAEEAIRLVQKAMRLNPHYPPLYILGLGIAYHYAWQNEEAIATLRRYLSYNPDHISVHAALACSYSDVGREEEARAEAAEVLRLSPQFSLEAWSQSLPVKDPAELERHVNNARKAGLK